MLPLQLIREKSDWVKEQLERRYFSNIQLLNFIVEADKEQRQLQIKFEAYARQLKEYSQHISLLLREKNTEQVEIEKREISEIKHEMDAIKNKKETLQNKIDAALAEIPNLPHQSAPQGKSEKQNVIVKEVQRKETSLQSTHLRPHWELTKEYDLVHLDLGTKVVGSGFPFYKGMGAALQRSLIHYCLEANRNAGYTEYQSPLLVNEQSAFGTGQLPDKEDQMYEVQKDGLYLIPTSEVPLTNIYRNCILVEAQLPIKLTGHTPCFRREAGSYGKDVRGLNRIHQFEKVEIVQIVHPDSSYQVFEEMLAHVEQLIMSLGLSYRILKLCTGDTGLTSALTYDFEVYSPGQKKWLEVSSLSNFETFQSNRLQLRYKDSNSNKNLLAHTLNASALAMPRIIAAIIETYYQFPKGIKVPDVLAAYLKCAYITKNEP